MSRRGEILLTLLKKFYPYQTAQILAMVDSWNADDIECMRKVLETQQKKKYGILPGRPNITIQLQVKTDAERLLILKHYTHLRGITFWITTDESNKRTQESIRRQMGRSFKK